MSDVFSLYEDNLNEIMDKMRTMCSSFQTLSRDKAEGAITSGTTLIKEGEGILNKMTIEVSSNTKADVSNSLQIKVKNYKNEFSSLKNKFLSIQSNYINKKAENAIMFGIEGEGKDQNIELIANENLDEIDRDNANNTGIESNNHNNSLNIENKVDIIQGNNDTIPDDNDLNVKIDKKNKKIIFYGIIGIISVLVALIIFLTVYFSVK